MGKKLKGLSYCTALLLLVFLPTALSSRADQEGPSTFETWKFNASGDILGAKSVKDISGDGVDDVVIATDARSIYLVDGLNGKKIWNYTADKFYSWLEPITSSKLDVNNDTKSEILAAEKNGLVMLLDGATGAQLWNITIKDQSYQASDPCLPIQRQMYITSDIDKDGLPDAVIISGSGDQCTKNDKFSAVALGTKNGQKLWEFVHDEDYHGLKDGTRGSSPTITIDLDKNGVLDLAIVDDLSILYLIDGSTGSLVREKELDIQGAIWNLLDMPDISGDNIDDVLAFEFIDGAGGPDYSSIDAVDLAGSKVLWQDKVGDGLYKGGALYSSALVADNNPAPRTVFFAVTERIDEQVQVVLIDANTGSQSWQFALGEDKSKDDLGKYYPVSGVPDLNKNNFEEIAVGSTGSKVYLLDGKDGTILWSYSVGGGPTEITSLSTSNLQQYIIAANQLSEVRAMAGLTAIRTDITLRPSSQNVTLSSKVVISGILTPSLPGELVELRYIDPTGSVTTKPLIVEKGGSFSDTTKPELVGIWKVTAEFKGEGYYLDSKSPTITFSVENETRNSVYMLEVKAEEGGGVTRYPISYLVQGGSVNSMSINEQERSLSIGIEPTPDVSGERILKIELPRSVIEAFQSSYQVYIDGKTAAFQELNRDQYTQQRTLSIPFSSEARQITVIGTYVVPEFAGAILLIVTFSIIAVIAFSMIYRKSFANSGNSSY